MFALPVLVIAGGRTARGMGQREVRQPWVKRRRGGKVVLAAEGGRRRFASRGLRDALAVDDRCFARARASQKRRRLPPARRTALRTTRAGAFAFAAGRGRAIARLGGHVHTGTTVVSSASSSPSPFLRFRRFLNPGKDKISSFGVGRAPAALRPRPAACRLTPASSLRRHSRNSRTWLSACRTLFK